MATIDEIKTKYQADAIGDKLKERKARRADVMSLLRTFDVVASKEYQREPVSKAFEKLKAAVSKFLTTLDG